MGSISIYSVEKRADGWVISAGGDEILTCSRRATAIRIIQQAGLDLLTTDFGAGTNDCTDCASCEVVQPLT
jgi:hypothetical protein